VTTTEGELLRRLLFDADVLEVQAEGLPTRLTISGHIELTDDEHRLVEQLREERERSGPKQLRPTPPIFQVSRLRSGDTCAAARSAVPLLSSR